MFKKLKKRIEISRERRFYNRLMRMYYKDIQRISYESLRIMSDKTLTEEEKNVKLCANVLRRIELNKCVDKCREFLEGLK